MDGSLITSPAHPFLDGTVKKLLIDGQWIGTASGKTFGTLNPTTLQVIARVAEGSKAVTNLAAAHTAFEGSQDSLAEDAATVAPAGHHNEGA